MNICGAAVLVSLTLAVCARAGERLDRCLAFLGQRGLAEAGEGYFFEDVAWRGWTGQLPVLVRPGDPDGAVRLWGIVPLRVFDLNRQGADPRLLEEHTPVVPGLLTRPEQSGDITITLAQAGIPLPVQVVWLHRSGRVRDAETLEAELSPPGPELEAELQRAEQAVLDWRLAVMGRVFQNTANLEQHAKDVDEALARHAGESSQLVWLREWKTWLAWLPGPPPEPRGPGVTAEHRDWCRRLFALDARTLRHLLEWMPEDPVYGSYPAGEPRIQDELHPGRLGFDAIWLCAALVEMRDALPAENSTINFRELERWSPAWDPEQKRARFAPVTLADVGIMYGRRLCAVAGQEIQEDQPLAPQFRALGERMAGVSREEFAIRQVRRALRENAPVSSAAVAHLARCPQFDEDPDLRALMTSPDRLLDLEPAWIRWVVRRGRDVEPLLRQVGGKFDSDLRAEQDASPVHKDMVDSGYERGFASNYGVVRRCFARLSPETALTDTLREGARSTEWLNEQWARVGETAAAGMVETALKQQSNATIRALTLLRLARARDREYPQPTRAPSDLIARAEWWRRLWADETPVALKERATKWDDQPEWLMDQPGDHTFGQVALVAWWMLQEAYHPEPPTAGGRLNAVDFLIRTEEEVGWRALRSAAEAALANPGAPARVPSADGLPEERVARLRRDLAEGRLDETWLRALSLEDRLWLWSTLGSPRLPEGPPPAALWSLANRILEVRDDTAALPAKTSAFWGAQGLSLPTVQSMIEHVRTRDPAGRRVQIEVTRESSLRGVRVRVKHAAIEDVRAHARWGQYWEGLMENGAIFAGAVDEDGALAWTPVDHSPLQHLLVPSTKHGPSLSASGRLLALFGPGAWRPVSPAAAARFTVGTTTLPDIRDWEQANGVAEPETKE